LEFKTTNAKLEYSKGTAELEISRDNGGLSIHSRAIRLNLDTFESRNSISPTTARATLQSAQQGRQAAYEATATYAQQGQLLLNAKIGQELVTQFAADAQTKDLKTNVGLQFLPTVGPDISWEPAEMNIRYEMDKLNFDWRVNQAELEFIPGDIEISVKQQPDVIIKYVGGPLYVPPSSDPDYEPVDVEA
jgi:predicted Rdx family selenoprotein